MGSLYFGTNTGSGSVAFWITSVIYFFRPANIGFCMFGAPGDAPIVFNYLTGLNYTTSDLTGVPVSSSSVLYMIGDIPGEVVGIGEIAFEFLNIDRWL